MTSYVALAAGVIGLAWLARAMLRLWDWLQMYKKWSKIPGNSGGRGRHGGCTPPEGKP